MSTITCKTSATTYLTTMLLVSTRQLRTNNAEDEQKLNIESYWFMGRNLTRQMYGNSQHNWIPVTGDYSIGFSITQEIDAGRGQKHIGEVWMKKFCCVQWGLLASLWMLCRAIVRRGCSLLPEQKACGRKPEGPTVSRISCPLPLELHVLGGSDPWISSPAGIEISLLQAGPFGVVYSGFAQQYMQRNVKDLLKSDL